MKYMNLLTGLSITIVIVNSMSDPSDLYVLPRESSQVTIVKNNGILVNYGRSVALNPKDLTIAYDSDGHCEVSILKNDPLSSCIGGITPPTFPCDFKADSVYYQHYGSMTQLTDVIKLQVRLDTKEETIVKPFMLRVKVKFDKPLEILNKVENLIVDELGGLSEPINPNILSFKFNKKNQDCKVRFLPKNNGPPFYGSIVNTSDVNRGLDTVLGHDASQVVQYKYVTCSQFLSGHLRYAHERMGKYSNRDYVPLLVEVYNKQSAVVEKREFIQVPVRIRRAPENQRPIINYNSASYSLQVDQLVLTAVTSSVMRAEDRETDHGSIIFNITHPFKKGQGYFVHTDDPTRPLTTFYQKEIDELKIAYRPPDTLSTNQRLQQIWLEAKDSQGASSSPFYVIVVIKPMNAYAPQVIKNSGLTMFEGQSRALTREVLEIRDPGNEDDVTVGVIQGLFHGRLEKNGQQISEFSVQDIDRKAVRYAHDDSDTYSDNMILRISDGTHQLDLLLLVTIIPRDDQPPSLTYNTGISLNEGSVINIDQFDLSANDIDSDDTKIKFMLIDLPMAGYLCYRRANDPPNNTISKWQLRDNAYERQIQEFFQVDIVLGIVYYRHFGAEIFQDMMTFRVLDGARIPNESGLKSFIITINPVDDLVPKLFPGCPLKMSAVELQVNDLSKKYLQYTDDDSPDNDLIYLIHKQPYFSDVEGTGGINAGSIVLANKPQMGINTFTQKQLNHFKVKYKPLKQDLGVRRRTVKFEFNVSDVAGNTLTNQLFSIQLKPVNNKIPVPIISVLTVKERERKGISLSHLRAFDSDNNEEDLSFALKKRPKYGEILLQGRKLSIGSTVTIQDIQRRQLEYVHDGSETTRDDVKFVLTDGLHVVSVHLPIVVQPVDDEAPYVKLLTKTITVCENGIVSINSNIINVSDQDSDGQLTFIVVKSPKYGQIEKGGVSVESFKLRDVVSGIIAYRHTSGEIGVSSRQDALNLTLSDMSNDLVVGGNIYSGIVIDIRVEPVDSEPPVVQGLRSLQVAEAGQKVIEKHILHVTDEDTDLKEVNCKITLSPLYGFIKTSSAIIGSEKSRAGIPLSSFTAYDLQHGFVSYVQNKHKGIEPTSDRFNVKCNDGNNSAVEVKIYVGITATNDEKPIVFVQPNIVCVENDLILFDLAKINPYDRDQPEDELTITVTRQPLNGELLLQKTTELKQANVFTKSALTSHLDTTLIYRHKGSETTSDSFEIQVDDGVHNVTKEVDITIIAMDDETPRMIVNTGLQLDRGETKVITYRNLKAVDLDSEDSELMFVVMVDGQLGRLQKTVSPSLVVDIGKGGNFTQADLEARKVRYTHLNNKVGDRDTIRLDVTDGFNRLINQIFNVLITPLDNVLPSIINTGITLTENGQITLTTDMLSASDLNTPDENLQFVITKTPLKGHLEHTDNIGVPITTFSQLDLAANKIIYIHTSDDEVKFDNFEFEVTDGTNKVFRTFRIKLTNVNNKKPTLKLSIVDATQGQSSLLTPFEINAIDNDTVSAELKYRIHEPPRHGKILMDGADQVFTFTQLDIENNRIIYQHDNSDTRRDRFSVTLSDGIHKEFFVRYQATDETIKSADYTRTPVEVMISVKPNDRKAPVLVINKGASALRMRQSLAMFKLSAVSLKAMDRDTEDESIKFSIQEPPKHGRIVRLDKLNQTVSKFTQADIYSRQIAYVLNKNCYATNDMFMFNVYDDKKNVLRAQTFHLRWAWVTIEKSFYSVNETDKFVNLEFMRSGHLDETSFASLDIVDQTAKQFSHFEIPTKQIQFSPGQATATLQVKLIDDSKFEKKKTFLVVLKHGFKILIGKNNNTTVDISDPEDEPTVGFIASIYKTKESNGSFVAPVHRKGDLSDVTRIICATESDSADGTIDGTVTSNRDYISRQNNDRSSIIAFETNETTKNCVVKIIDDSLFEEEEVFTLYLVPYYGGRVDKTFSLATVSILQDERDEPQFSLDATHYEVDESNGNIQVIVKRHGTDLSITSYLLFATKQLVPVSARAYSDYHPMVTMLKFDHGVRERIVNVKVIDDTGRPRIEGKEKFTVLIKTPRNARLTSPSEATVTIDDTESDKPQLLFNKLGYSVEEGIGNLSIEVERIGDLRHETYVRCYTRQNTATVEKDYVERRNTNDSFIKFEKREHKKDCVVSIIDDAVFEPDEEFKVVLGMTDSATAGGAKVLAARDEVIINIKDNDKPIIEFKKKRFYIREPTVEEKERTITVPVYRTGDVTKTSIVTVFTRDGSAKSGTHYEPIAKVLVFRTNVTYQEVKITVNYFSETSLRTTFSLNLLADVDQLVEFSRKKTVVYIEERGHRTGVTFPLNPLVVSLMDYDDTIEAKKNPIQGYPLVCVTACNSKFPRYTETKSICKDELINNDVTHYRWQVAAPGAADGVTNEFKDINMKIFFTTIDAITLDSVYFTASSRIRCVAQAFSEDGNIGVESYSEFVTIDRTEGLCMPRGSSDIGAETFSAQVSYTGLEDKHPNLVKLKVLIPHFDGLLPVISTKKLSNFELTLSPDASRFGQHKCSNLLNYDEVTTRYGFIKNYTKNESRLTESQPHQFDWKLRGMNAIRFYRNLNLDACLWTFESFYDMTELVQECGGRIVTDGQVKDAVQSQLVIHVPLHVSYIYHSANDVDGWTDINHHSSFRLTALYDTGVLWRDGVGLPEKGQLKGNLHPASIIVRKTDKKLQVKFRTKARFRGLFILQHKGGKIRSEVISPDRPKLSFRLTLIRSDPTFSEPEQLWQMTSEYAVRDYSGLYVFRLIPCTVADDVDYSWPPDCTPQNPVSFRLNFTIQQTSEPVEATFSLNMRFFLMNSFEQWTSPVLKSSQVTDVFFKEGEPIFGRVMVDASQAMGDAYHVIIEKVFLCSGLDGFIPTFNPKTDDFGCIADAPTLMHRFKILDRLNPETEETQFRSVRFNASLAVDNTDAHQLVSQAGSDGFSLDSTPLFKVSVGRSWFLHVIYSFRSQREKHRGIGRRSLDNQFHAVFVANDNHRKKRDTSIKESSREIQSIGVTKGTNLRMILLSRPSTETKEIGERTDDSRTANGSSGRSDGFLIAVIVMALIILVGATVGAILYRKCQSPTQNTSVSGEDGGTEI